MVVSWNDAAWSWLVAVVCWAEDVLRKAAAASSWAGVVVWQGIAALGRAAAAMSWAATRRLLARGSVLTRRGNAP